MNDPLIVLRRTIEVHHALDDAGIGHAVGGALSLAYHVGEARATQDIDLNVALAGAAARPAFEALPAEVPWDDSDLALVAREGQLRLRWPVPEGPPMPLDLFFAEHTFHDQALRRAVFVRMLDDEVPILTATDLTVFKALFDRPKDWVDIADMVTEAPPSLDVAEAAAWVRRIVGEGDPRAARLEDLLAR